MHTGAIPVSSERLAVPININPILLAEAQEKKSCNPDIVSSLFRSFTKDLELPLSLRYFGINAFVIDACMQALPEMLFSDLSAESGHVLEANSAVIFALRLRISFRWKADGNSVLCEEIFLLKSEPSSLIIKDCSSGVRWVRISIREHDLAHHQSLI